MAPDSESGPVNILLVDDRPEQRLSLASVLADLGENVVEVACGRAALRELLHQEFAVILLDVNMPGMDGLETAALIRQRKSCEHTPIIFLTAYSDDTHALRGYSVGAVDYILTPVEPQVLRTKVAVFVDLFRKTREVERQAASLRERAAQLHQLTEAALAINSELSIDRVLQVVTDRAATIIGAHQSLSSTTVDQNGSPGCFVFLSDAYAEWRNRPLELAHVELDALVASANLPMRLTSAAVDANPRLARHRTARTGQLPMRGWLAAPLTGRDGRNLGVVQVSDKVTGEFGEDDEAILVQLAQMASIAIENTLYSKAREANRLKDEFLGTLSHELRTPLQAMLTWTQVLRQGDLDPAAFTRGLDAIERSAKAQTQLIEELLDISRIINSKLRVEPRPLNVVNELDTAIDMVRPLAAAKDIKIKRTFATTPCRISADPHRLQQVIWNLLSNAVKFTPNGGRVEVGLQVAEGQARIRVGDSGKGIPPDFLPHIFERFRQADSSSTRTHGGLGIGLFLVQRLVELHGGRVRAESAGEGKGATFTVELPVLAHNGRSRPALLSAGAEGSPMPVTTAGNGQRLDGVRVVVVEDEDDARECLTLALQQRGAAVTAVGSVAAALAALERGLPDVLVCDIGMPEQDGYSLIRTIRARTPERGGQLPAAALTAYVRSEDRARAVRAGFNVHVTKPVEPGHLARVVSELAGKAVTRVN